MKSRQLKFSTWWVEVGSTKENKSVECYEKEAMIYATKNCKVREEQQVWDEIKFWKREKVQLSEGDGVAKDDVDVDVEAGKIALLSRSAGSPSHQTS